MLLSECLPLDRLSDLRTFSLFPDDLTPLPLSGALSLVLPADTLLRLRTFLSSHFDLYQRSNLFSLALKNTELYYRFRASPTGTLLLYSLAFFNFSQQLCRTRYSFFKFLSKVKLELSHVLYSRVLSMHARGGAHSHVTRESQMTYMYSHMELRVTARVARVLACAHLNIRACYLTCDLYCKRNSNVVLITTVYTLQGMDTMMYSSAS